MKYCVSSRQPMSVLKKVDEIRVTWKDKDYVLDLVEKCPDKTIILEWDGSNPEWKNWQMYSEKFAGFILCIQNLFLADILNQEGVKWYWGYPITSFAELQGVVALEPAYVELGPPLSFSLKKVKAVTDIPCRMVVNDPKPLHMPVADTIKGQYVRPEDISVYEEWIDCVEFKTESLKEESAYFKLYSEQKNWPGNLNLIIKDLGMNVDNRGILEDFGERRANCGQRCMEGRGCGYCKLALEFTEKVRAIAKNRNIDNQ